MEFDYDMPRKCVYGEDNFYDKPRIVAFLTREELNVWCRFDSAKRHPITIKEAPGRTKEFSIAREECMRR